MYQGIGFVFQTVIRPCERYVPVSLLCLRDVVCVDMTYLKKSDLQNGILIYQRKKTKQMLQIKWLKHMQDIIDKYLNNNCDYLLSVIKKGGNERL